MLRMDNDDLEKISGDTSWPGDFCLLLGGYKSLHFSPLYVLERAAKGYALFGRRCLHRGGTRLLAKVSALL